MGLNDNDGSSYTSQATSKDSQSLSQFSTTDMDIFKKDMPLKPETNVSEAREKDAKLLLKYENTLYTIATLSAATIIITTIILARE